MSAISHASPQPDTWPSIDHATGEVRIPLSLVGIDQVIAQTLLVLSRVEADRLLSALAAALTPARALTGVPS